MIFPYIMSLDKDCNVVFNGRHIPSGKKEVIDRVFKCWETKLTYDPLSKEYIKTECNCPDCEIKRAKGDTEYKCKHIIEDLQYLGLII